MTRSRLRSAAPALTSRIDELTGAWLGRLAARLADSNSPPFRPKQVNDPIWGTIELLPWEVALLDTPLLQRMRGVRQLGLAQLVFPSACHDRLEHIIGVIGAVELTLRSLDRQVERWNRDHSDNHLPRIRDTDRYALRLAALFHDLGHGPFSHALEPVLEPEAVLRGPGGDPVDPANDWRGDFDRLSLELQAIYSYNAKPPISELIAILIVLSQPVTDILNDRKFPLGIAEDSSTDALQNRMIAAITGAVEGPGADHLSAVISGQIDADKLDYLQRDAYHAGLEIGFDISRLMSRIEILQVREDNINASVGELRERVNKADRKTLLQLGIAASGFGSFEQMLIGRTFLYDRLYHHHKVRAAEAMAQRLILLAERDREERFEFADLFLNLSDESFLRLFSGDLTHSRISTPSQPSIALARGILDRDLLHRAFALRGRFISVAPDLNATKADHRRQTLWRRVVGDLKTLKSRFDLGVEIHEVAVRAADALITAGCDVEPTRAMRTWLEQAGPEQVIVDLPALKADAIRILARYPNGALRIPEFSFNPYKWSNAYELQKRTAYVFCPRDVVPIIALAAKIVFFGRYGIVMAEEADGFIKAGQNLPTAWIDALVDGGLIDATARRFLTVERRSLLTIEAQDLRIPQSWLDVDEDVGVRLASALNTQLSGGLASEHLEKLRTVLEVMWRLVDHWLGSGKSTEHLANEAALQKEVRAFLEAAGLQIDEGTKAGGGELDLYVADAILLENKIEGATSAPQLAKPAAGMQGRRYAIALDTQIVLTVVAYQPKPGALRDKSQSVTVHSIGTPGHDRVEIRIALPYGAVVPSREKVAKR
jgi:HD superfamily phosphohydrolase